ESGQYHQKLKPENRELGNENRRNIGSVVYSLVGKTPEPLPVGKRTFSSTDRLCLFEGPELASGVAFAGPSPRTAVRGLAGAKRELTLGLPWPSEYPSSQT